ncbi:MAG: hypothetical protein QM499_01230 [Flavobacteriaceae bacterium]
MKHFLYDLLRDKELMINNAETIYGKHSTQNKVISLEGFATGWTSLKHFIKTEIKRIGKNRPVVKHAHTKGWWKAVNAIGRNYNIEINKTVLIIARQ